MAEPDKPAPTDTPRRPIRSFVLRAGRMGPGQARALETLGPRYVLPYTSHPCDLELAFGRTAPRVLEIGFGMGDATAPIAQALPETDFHRRRGAPARGGRAAQAHRRTAS